MCSMKQDRLQIRIDNETKQLLEEAAKKNDVSMAYVVRWLVRHFIHLLQHKEEAK